jgi:DNA-binding MarR family transcriptional regulator
MRLTRQSEKAPLLRDLPSRLLAQTAALVGRAVSEVLEAEGAHRHQFAVLATLEAFGALSQAELCRRTDLDRSDMNTIVNALEVDGSVTRAVDADNRRRNIVTLTARGRRRFARLKARLEEVQDRVLKPLSQAERSELMRLLEVLHDHLTSAPAPGVERPESL